MNKNRNLQFLDLPQIAAASLHELHEETGVGWFDGGCLTFAKGLMRAYPGQLELWNVTRTQGKMDHAVVRIPELNVFGDANGWFTADMLKQKMFRAEALDFPFLEPVTKDTDMLDVEHTATVVDHIANSISFLYHRSATIPGTGMVLSWTEGDNGACAIVDHDVSDDDDEVDEVISDVLTSMVLGHFGSGVDVFSPAYVDGLESARNAIGSNI